MSGLQLALLGGFEARLARGPVLQIAPKKSRALLAYLAIARQRPQPREKLAALLWGDVPEQQSRQSLRKAVWELREALAEVRPPPLLMDGETIALTVCAIDVHRFEALARERSPVALREAMALYRGHLLEDFRVGEPAFEEWLTLERERLRRLAVEMLDRLLPHEISQGRVESAVEAALRLVVLNPLHEAAHRSLVGLYALQGRRDAALRQYRAYSEALWRDLREKPGPEIEQVYRQILAGSTAVRSAGAPSVLVVEDEVVTRTRLQELLASAGYQIVVAVDGADALFQIGHGTFDLVLADIRMPLLDGVKLLEIVRDKCIDTPVVLMTAYTEAGQEARCLAMGAADFVTKPFDGRALLARLGNALQRARNAHVQ